MTLPGRRATAFGVLCALLATLLAARAHYSADLSAFLPRHPSAAQRELIQQLRGGPAARLIVAAIGGVDAPTRARLSLQLAQELRRDPEFESIENGDATTIARDRDFLFAQRYVLSPAVTPERFSVPGLHAAIADSLDALASSEGALLKPFFAQDPTGELLALLDSLTPGPAPRTLAGAWSSRDGSLALLLLQTRAKGSDLDAQQRACNRVHSAFERLRRALPAGIGPGLTLTLSGPPVFAVASRALIIREVMRLSALGTLLIALLLLAVYRSLPALLLGLVPVIGGALAGVAAVAAGFPTVHGITLGFGITLIGEAVDYSIYLFVQGRGTAQRDWRQGVWPTVRLGALTSIVGFAALVPSSFPGLAQLGLYSVAGLAAAALITRYLLPAWIPARLPREQLVQLGIWLQPGLARLRRWRAVLLLLPLLAGAVLYLHRGALLSGELAALSPLPLAQQQLDERLRADLGAPDVRFMLILPAPSAEAALAATERVATHLAPLADAGTLGSFEYAARYLPSAATQAARRAALPSGAELDSRLQAALAGLPVAPATLAPFEAAVEAARTAATLTRAQLAGTSFATAVDTLLQQSREGYRALVPLAARASGDLSESAVEAVRTAVAAADVPGGVLLDLKREADGLYADYLTQAIRLALAGCATIVLLLLLALRSIARVARVLAPLILAVAAVAALLIACGEHLTILHLVGMLLIVAVGSNYALFFDRRAQEGLLDALPLTLASLLVANLATVLGFGVLALARVPMLADLGRTVAPGAFCALLFSAMLSAQPRRP
jgi:predicted exporter